MGAFYFSGSIACLRSDKFFLRIKSLAIKLLVTTKYVLVNLKSNLQYLGPDTENIKLRPMCLYSVTIFRCGHLSRESNLVNVCEQDLQQLARISDPKEPKDIVPYEWLESCMPKRLHNVREDPDPGLCEWCASLEKEGWKLRGVVRARRQVAPKRTSL